MEMNPNKLVKALRACASGEAGDCPFTAVDGCGGCPKVSADLIERLSGEVENLRRKLAMSDKDVTAAHLHFSQWQAAFTQLTQTVSRIEDEGKVGELCAAIRAQLAAWGKAMEGTT
jgi:hypothetical protein